MMIVNFVIPFFAGQIYFGGVDDDDITDMSGGFEQTFTVNEDGTGSITFSYKVDMSHKYEDDEYAEVLVSIDGQLVDVGGNDYVARVHDGDIGWTTVTIDLGDLEAGDHTVMIGGYNNKKTTDDEKTKIDFDDISLVVEPDDAGSVYDVDFYAALTDDSETLSAITVNDLPNGVVFNGIDQNEDGTWTLNPDDLDGLTMTVPEGTEDFNISASVTSTADNGDTATTTATHTIDVMTDSLGEDTDDTIVGTMADDDADADADADADSGEDILYGGAGDDNIDGQSGDDELFGGSGVDYIDGGAGGDVIYGGSDDDVIIGGEGNDQLYGGSGDDEFIFSLGDGDDTVFDFDNGDVLTFDGIDLNDGDSVQFEADGDDVVVTVIGSNDEQSKVTLKDAAKDMDDADRANVGDGYSVTDTKTGDAKAREEVSYNCQLFVYFFPPQHICLPFCRSVMVTS